MDWITTDISWSWAWWFGKNAKILYQLLAKHPQSFDALQAVAWLYQYSKLKTSRKSTASIDDIEQSTRQINTTHQHAINFPWLHGNAKWKAIVNMRITTTDMRIQLLTQTRLVKAVWKVYWSTMHGIRGFLWEPEPARRQSRHSPIGDHVFSCPWAWSTPGLALGKLAEPLFVYRFIIVAIKIPATIPPWSCSPMIVILIHR